MRGRPHKSLKIYGGGVTSIFGNECFKSAGKEHNFEETEIFGLCTGFRKGKEVLF